MKNVLWKYSSPFGLIISILFHFSLFAQDPPQSMDDAFFLDLGIVIEPGTGKEEVNRLIKAPSKQVSFFLNKEPSGSVFMASTKELQQTLDRIMQRMETLESAIYSLQGSFEKEVTTLKSENSRLREMISDLLAQEPVIPPELETLVSRMEEAVSEVEQLNNRPIEQMDSIAVPGLHSSEKLEEYEESSNPTETSPSFISEEPPDVSEQAPSIQKKDRSFNKLTYMAAVFAYQREDYRGALKQFQKLFLDNVEDVTAGNVLYWMADCYYQLGEYQKALHTLAKIRPLLKSDKLDDALILTGLSFRHMGEESQAVAAFNDVVIHYPESEYFKLAQMELRKSEKR